MSCAVGHCRKTQKLQPSSSKAYGELLPPKASAEKKIKTIRVYKYDGSKQCSKGRHISIESMKKSLEGIPIYSQRKVHDGLMRIQVCGQGTGRANVYEIPNSELKNALGRGFKEWSF